MDFKSTGKRNRQFSDISNLSTSGSELDLDLDKPGSPRWCSDQNPVTSPPHLDLKTLRVIVSQDYGSAELEYESDGSDMEARSFTSYPKLDGDGQPSDSLDLRPRAGIAIRKYSFSEENPRFNLYAPFPNYIDYQLAQFFSSSKISSAKINKFFEDGILKDLNPTYIVQCRSAHTLHKLMDATTNEPSWYSGKVNYPLQKGVKFRYRKLISVVKYLLRQKVYADNIVWGPHTEYDKQRNRVYSEIDTGTWWEDNQVGTFRPAMPDIPLIVSKHCFRKEQRLFRSFWLRMKLT